MSQLHKPLPVSSSRESPFSSRAPSRAGTPISFREVVEAVIERMKNEGDSEAHQIYRSYTGHGVKGQPATINPDEETIPGVVHPGSTGVIYCTDRAIANGFSYADSHSWSNLGQGAPEVGPIPDAPPRPTTINMQVDELEYAPTTGVKALREAVANMYNEIYRKGMKNKYTFENVCIVPGGRSGLSRVAAVVGDVYLGFQVPDYTAYAQSLEVFRRLVPIPTALEAENGYRLDIKQVRRDISNQGLSVLLASNPRNPTGQLIEGDELRELVRLSKQKTTLILDEFYSWYIYHDKEEDIGKSVSGAAYIDDVNEDPVIIIDGLTKNWRLPGWRVCWVLGPKNVISALSQSGSFLDGGANHPLQIAALPLLSAEHIKQEKIALQVHFKKKRDHVLERLAKLGLKVVTIPHATFYIWLDLEGLPDPLNNGLTFFEELLKEKTIVVPGIFFDINPSHRRDLFRSPCHHFVRLSFGPPLKDLDMGLDAIEKVLKRAKKEGHKALGHGYKKSADLDLATAPTVS
ncbi:PLP-dependent transferase [Serendipita vermifera]|nr:PLP-dependent transferase [Serendipita vermifera]